MYSLVVLLLVRLCAKWIIVWKIFELCKLTVGQTLGNVVHNGTDSWYGLRYHNLRIFMDLLFVEKIVLSVKYDHMIVYC